MVPVISTVPPEELVKVTSLARSIVPEKVDVPEVWDPPTVIVVTKVININILADVDTGGVNQ